MTQKPKNTPPVHEKSFEEWLVPSRSQVQEALLRLLLLVRTKHEQLKGSQYRQVIASLLAGIGFSLWRAVFLADNKNDLLYSIDKFLETVIRDNAIGYRDDKNIWSFGYYVGNARSGLLEAIKIMPPAYRNDLKDIGGKLEGPEFFRLEGKRQWGVLIESFVKATKTFEEMIEGPKLNKLWG
jgi:hypothetical protein